MSWDWLISILIIAGLILAFWAKMSRQTVGELLADIKERLSGQTEETVNYATEVVE